MRARRHFLALAAAPLTAQSSLPTPDEADLPYILQLRTLIPTNRLEATEEEDGKFYKAWVPGPAATAKTPIASPEFLLLAETVQPGALKLYRFEVVKGRREVVLRKKKKTLARPYLISAYKEGDNLYRIRTDESLPRGEYGLSPDGSSAVFCFAVV